MCATHAQTSNRASKTSKRLSQTGHRDSLTHLPAFARVFVLHCPRLSLSVGKGPLRWQSVVGLVGLPVGCLWYPELVFYAAHMGRSPQVWPDPIPPKHSVAGITRYDTRLDTGPRDAPPCAILPCSTWLSMDAGLDLSRPSDHEEQAADESDKGGLKNICAMLSPFAG